MEKLADIIEIAELPMLEELLVTDDGPSTDEMLIVEEPQMPVEKDFDWDKNKDFTRFLSYLTGKIGKIPQHSGNTTAGCERAIVYLKMLDKEISKAVGEDLNCKINDEDVEKLRKQIRKMIKQLQKRHNEINDAYDADDAKFASVADEIVKEAEENDANDKATKWRDKYKTHDAAGEHEKAAEMANMIAAFHDDKFMNDTERNDYHDRQRNKWWDLAKKHKEHKKAHVECACQVEKTATPEDGMCPTCNIQLWATDEAVMECVACEAVFEKKLTKEAHTARLTLVMTPFERAVSGAIINGFVAGGKNPEEIYDHFKKKYSFTDRDELSIQQILYDMGYSILKDRGHLGDKSEQLNKGMGIEFATQYNA